tara:strand:+ start:38021 stop:38158 length:138 start_codon:yes stop_codon:yes gene_type:complete
MGRKQWTVFSFSKSPFFKAGFFLTEYQPSYTSSGFTWLTIYIEEK